MKIIKLSASNVMRLRAVEVEPQGTVQIVAGKNGAGKSSLLNALYLALAGGAASREIAKPVRAGEEWAEVKLDLGTILVTRTWDENGKTSLTVKAADGATYKSPQTLLDSLLGALTFDPLEFTRQRPADQRRTLLDLLGLDFTEADEEKSRLYDLRLETGRRMHAFGDLPKLDKLAPMRETSATEIIGRIRQANQIEQDARNLQHQQRERVARIEAIDRQVDALRAQIRDLEGEADGHRQAIASLADLLDATPEPEDTAALQEQLASIEDHNKTVRENVRIARAREEQKALEKEYTALTHQIDGIEATKARAIAAAAMPVPGLGFDDSGVLFGGVPFGQASSAEQIRVSLAMAIAMNPTLRVIRIMDGSLLDSDSMAEIRAAAEESDIQVWIEVVGENPDDPTAIVIEDGEVLTR